MNKKILLFLALVSFTSLILASTSAALPEIIKPETILVDNGKIFITEGIHIYIYALKDFKLQKKIGKQGEGPREFKKMQAPWLPSLYVFLKPDHIFVNSIGKESLFTREGDFVKEIKTSRMSRLFIPFGEKYIGWGSVRENNIGFLTYNLHDSQFKKEKEISRVKNPQQPGKKINPIVMAVAKKAFFRYASKKNFFLPTRDGIMHVYDISGKEVFTIKPDYQKVQLDAEQKNKYDKFFSTDVRFKRLYALSKANIEFPDYLPLLNDYRVSDDKVYIISNKKDKNAYESFIYDFNGQLLKKVWLPLVDKDMLEVYPFTIKAGNIYQLIENEDQEEWELHITRIK